MQGPVEIYDVNTNQLLSYIYTNELVIQELIWDKCHTVQYNCVYLGHFGATFNCLGWALGISKWLDPREIDAYVEEGLTKAEALKKFIASKAKLYPKTDESNIDGVVSEFNHFSADLHLENATIAFHFEGSKCHHGARFLESLNGISLERWNSKLGSTILIANDERDLIGENSLYGEELFYVGISKDHYRNDHNEL